MEELKKDAATFQEPRPVETDPRRKPIYQELRKDISDISKALRASMEDIMEEEMPDYAEGLLELMDRRDAFGIKKYGESLHTFNGRSMAIDAFQELMDLNIYLRGYLMEKGEPEDQLEKTKLRRVGSIYRSLLIHTLELYRVLNIKELETKKS